MKRCSEHRNQARRDTVSEIIAALAWGPKTIEQIIEVAGCAEDTARAWIAAFHRSGLVRIENELLREDGTPGRRPILWAWQATPFALEDATK